jgi:hypothetical protein
VNIGFNRYHVDIFAQSFATTGGCSGCPLSPLVPKAPSQILMFYMFVRLRELDLYLI